jgi:hypothetical protein
MASVCCKWRPRASRYHTRKRERETGQRAPLHTSRFYRASQIRGVCSSYFSLPELAPLSAVGSDLFRQQQKSRGMDDSRVASFVCVVATGTLSHRHEFGFS